MGRMSKKSHWTDDVSKLLRVSEGFVLSGVDPDSTPGFVGGKEEGARLRYAKRKVLGEYQDKLYARSQVDATHKSVLLVLQAMDCSGKGGIVRHVVGSVDPQGVRITAFKKPTAEELKHDFLWRVRKALPEPGQIGVFDRSHYEDVLVAKVHDLASPEEIEGRYDKINDFEEELREQGTYVLKVMLHISYDEQRDRLLRRLDRTDKQWKFTPSDVEERGHWPHYMSAFQTMFDRTSTDHAPWYVVPADHKWYARLAVEELLLHTFRAIEPQWPVPDYDVEAQRARLLAS